MQPPVKKQWPLKSILECRKRHMKLKVSAAEKKPTKYHKQECEKERAAQYCSGLPGVLSVPKITTTDAFSSRERVRACVCVRT